MKILPYQDETFAKYRTESVQEFRFVLSRKIREQVFYAIFVENITPAIKNRTHSLADFLYLSEFFYNRLSNINEQI